jgi:hypothetical protein
LIYFRISIGFGFASAASFALQFVSNLAFASALLWFYVSISFAFIISLYVSLILHQRLL